MLARDLVEQVPTVGRGTVGAEAAARLAEYRLHALVVAGDDGVPFAVIPGSQLLALVVPQYVRDDPNLAHVYDEQGAGELCEALNRVTIGDLLDGDRLDAAEPPSVLPQDTLLEIAEAMLGGHTPVVLVRDERGGYHGVVTLTRLLAAIASAAGRQSPGLANRLDVDLIDGQRAIGRASERDDA